jgi:cell wall-associated NlpC family hydrolase
VRRRYRPDDQGVSKVQLAILVGAALILLSPLMLLPLFLAAGPAIYNSLHNGPNGACGNPGNQPGQSGSAKDIPRSYLDLYKAAGKKFGIPWNVLAGIGKEETNHGRSSLPGVHSGANYAGAGGPMQFLEATFKSYAVDGNHDGKKDRYNPADAIFTAAKYLKANGAPQKTWNAIWHYNHASWYVDDVLTFAKHYASGDFSVENDAPTPDCSNVNVPAGSSAAVQAVIAFARQQMGEKYVLGASGPDAWDCSSLMMKAYASIGVTIPRVTFAQWPFGQKVKKGQEQAGDLVFFAGSDGSMSNPGHVGLVIGHGKMIEAPHTGAVVRISSYHRPDLVGFTRPLAKKGVKPKLP